jgi:hypothetical protein
MRAQAEVTSRKRIRQAPQVALECVEIENQARCIDLGERHADDSRKTG